VYVYFGARDKLKLLYFQMFEYSVASSPVLIVLMHGQTAVQLTEDVELEVWVLQLGRKRCCADAQVSVMHCGIVKDSEWS
jgi:hypothetical protein